MPIKQLCLELLHRTTTRKDEGQKPESISVKYGA